MDLDKIRVDFNIPHGTKFDGVHLVPDGESMDLLMIKKVEVLKSFPMHGLAEATFYKMLETVLLDRHPIAIFDKGVVSVENLSKYFGAKTSQNIYDTVSKYWVSGVDPKQIVKSLVVDNSGDSISREVAMEFEGLTPDYTHKNKKVIEELLSKKDEYLMIRNYLTERNIKINPIEVSNVRGSSVFGSYVMTGSPKKFGFNTKKEFTNTIPNWTEVKSLKDGVGYLITDSKTSTSSKMKKAEKLEIKILTYDEVMEYYKDN